MDFLVPRPPLNGSKGAAAVPSGSNFARGNSASFFFVFTAEVAFRVAKGLAVPIGREEQGESLRNATKRATMHPKKRVAADAVVAEIRRTWCVLTEFETRLATRPVALAYNVVDQDSETPTTRSLFLRLIPGRATNRKCHSQPESEGETRSGRVFSSHSWSSVSRHSTALQVHRGLTARISIFQVLLVLDARPS